MDGPAGFTAAPPNASFTYNCYGLTRETYPSLHDCVDRCTPHVSFGSRNSKSFE